MDSEAPIVLYLEGSCDVEGSFINIPLETAIVYFTLVYCQNDSLQIVITLDSKIKFQHLSLQKETLSSSFGSKVHFLEHRQLPEIVKGCSLPALLCPDGITCIAGLCSVVRWTFKYLLMALPDHPCKDLLGFRQGCLSACAESSMWTKFCEVELPRATHLLLKELEKENIEAINLPEELVKVEAHLARPVKTHNILKRKQDLVKARQASNGSLIPNVSFLVKMMENATLHDKENTGSPRKSEGDKYELDHCFMEGIDFTISDLIVFVCIHLVWMQMRSFKLQLEEHFPRLNQWYQRLMRMVKVQENIKKINWPPTLFQACCPTISIPQVGPYTLYSKDKLEPKAKIRNVDPTPILNKLKAVENDLISIPRSSPDSSFQIKWDSLPPSLTLLGGELPAKRLLRKQQQLNSLISTVLQLSLHDDDVIVDFCSGGGHVGLILAHLLPKNEVLLIENKEASMSRAQQRAHKAGLKNVKFYQCNLDYFQRPFHLGVCLHACGSATDLVIHKCLEEQASLVCVPCCYGAIQESHLLSYPQSSAFKAVDITPEEYNLLAHCADRTEEGTEKQEEGKLCMLWVDGDRCLGSKEINSAYKMSLSHLSPLTCSPKHNIIIGVAPRHKHDIPVS